LVGRRGKYLMLRLTRDWLLFHLKMSGRLQLADGGEPADPHAHVVFSLTDGRELRFHDTRKFGRVYLVADPDEVVGGLGPEPLGEGLTEAGFVAALASRRGRLKPLLLDQTFLAGLGTLYTDEALWLAKLHPLMHADRLSGADAKRLLTAIRSVLEDAIGARGSTITSPGFRTLDGAPGTMSPRLAVFRRTGEPCPRCGTPIERIVVGQRSTHLCGRCQRR
jgi:formamidopyrimidine-DNA glycosylase